MTRHDSPEPEKERDPDVEPSQEFEKYEEFDREHRDEDERSYGEVYDEDVEGDFVPDDPGEFEKG